MSEFSNELIDKLEAISTETHLPLEKRMIDMAVWFHKNKDRMPRDEVVRRLDFLFKAFDVHLELIAMLIQRLQESEGRPKGTSLWLPNGMQMTDDFGRKTRFD